MTFLDKIKESEKGAALVEAALITPILLLLTFGIWSTARAWNISNTMDHAAREAARYGATVDPWDPTDPSGSPDAVRAIADADLSSSAISPAAVNDCIALVADAASPTCEGSHTNATGTDQIYVKLVYPNYGLNLLFFTIDLDITATAVSRSEAS